MFDIVFSCALVYDGSGQPPYIADVGVTGDAITAIERPGGVIPAEQARTSLDCTGLVLSPGFIDLHQHGDFTIQGAPDAPSQITQGVTTILTGNCGSSPFPGTSLETAAVSWAHLSPVFVADTPTAAGFMATVQDLRPDINVAFQVGFSSLRRMAMGEASRPADDEEIAHMIAGIHEAADAGVRGFSTGLIYAPGSYASAGEVRQLVAAAASRGLLYSTHMRDEGAGLLDSVRESLAAVGDGGRLEISHLKASGLPNHGLVTDAIAAIEQARAQGIDVTCDVYPFTASSTTLTSLFPGWSLDQGRGALPQRLRDPQQRAAVGEYLAGQLSDETTPEAIVIAAVSSEGPGGFGEYVGRSLSQIAEALDVPAYEAALRIVESHNGGVGMIHHAMSEDDVRTVLQYEHSSVASDGHVMALEGSGNPHPRNFGTFTRVLGHYVRDEHVLSLEDAVRKMTALPAQRLGLDDRGRVNVGAKADLVVFDPDTVDCASDWGDPWKPSTGVLNVTVNGEFALRDGELTRSHSGKVL